MLLGPIGQRSVRVAPKRFVMRNFFQTTGLVSKALGAELQLTSCSEPRIVNHVCHTIRPQSEELPFLPYVARLSCSTGQMSVRSGIELLLLLCQNCLSDDFHSCWSLQRLVVQRVTDMAESASCMEQDDPQTEFELHFLKLCCLGGAASSVIVRRIDEKLSSLAQPLPLSVMCSFLQLATPRMCQRLIQHHLSFRDSSQSSEDCASTLLRLWRAMLDNSCFWSPDDIGVMHEALLLLIRHSRSAKPEEGQGPPISPILVRLCRVYGRNAKAREFAELHRSIMERHQWIRDVLPLRYFTWLIGCHLDALNSAELRVSDQLWQERPHASQEMHQLWQDQYWQEVVQLVAEALGIFRRSNEVSQLWKLACKVALTISRMKTHTRLLDIYELFQAFGHKTTLDKNAVQQLLRYCGIGMQSERYLTELVRKTMKFLSAGVEKRSGWLIDCSVALLSYLKDAGRPDAAEAARVLREELEAALQSSGKLQYDVLRIPPLRKLLEHFGAVDPAAFWWTCGCGSGNMDISERSCYTCLRTKRGHWMCPRCHKAHSKPSTQCSCGEPHPAVVSRSSFDIGHRKLKECDEAARKAVPDESTTVWSHGNTFLEDYDFRVMSRAMHRRLGAHLQKIPVNHLYDVPLP